MAWRWTARRLLISAFLIVHLGATFVWVLPPCPIKERCFRTASYYILPLGLWQYWTMFAPDPIRDTVMLEAEVIDTQGLRHGYSFPHLADFSTWRGVPRFRHSKYAVNLAIDEFEKAREFAARHVVRQLNLPAEAFPVAVHLYYQVRPAPPPGSPADPMTPPRTSTLATFDFSSPSAVRP